MRFKSGIIFAAVILAILVLIPVSGHASSQETKQGVSDYFNLIAFSSNNDFLNVEEDDDIFLGEDEESLFKKDKKSVVRGFFYSLAIPGVGEYYAESKYKPYIFFSADVLLWSGYFLYNKKGRDTEDDFKAYANIHYDWTEYDDWWNFIIGLNADTASTYSHRLPAEKDHEYYENIGKYDQFVWGWDDWIEENGRNWSINPDTMDCRTPNREHYLKLRKDANDYFDRAKTLMIVSMVNHIVSAFDAAFTVKAYNRRTTSTIFSNVKIRMEPKFYGTDLYPQLTFYKGF